MKDAKPPVHISVLSSELLLKALRLLPFHNYPELALVCKEWQEIVYKHLLYYHVKICNTKQLILFDQSLQLQANRPDSLAQLKSANPVILELFISPFDFGCSEQVASAFERVLKKSAATIQNLNCCHLPLSDRLHRIIQKDLRFLSNLEFDAASLQRLDGLVSMPSAPNLRKIFVLKALKIPSTDLCVLLNLPRIQQIAIHEAPLLNETEFLQHLTVHGNALKLLELQSCPQITALTLETALHCCTSLENLVVINCSEQQYTEEELGIAVTQLLAPQDDSSKRASAKTPLRRVSEYLSNVVSQFIPKATSAGRQSDSNIADLGDATVSGSQASVASRLSLSIAANRFSASSQGNRRFSKESTSDATFHGSPKTQGRVSASFETLAYRRSVTDTGALQNFKLRNSALDSFKDDEMCVYSSLKTLAYSDCNAHKCLLPAKGLALRKLFLETLSSVSEEHCRKVVSLYPSIQVLTLSSHSINAIDVIMRNLQCLRALNTNGSSLELGQFIVSHEKSSLRVWHAEDCRWKIPNMGMILSTLLPRLEELSVSLQHSPNASVSFSGSSTMSVAVHSSSEHSTGSASPPSPSELGQNGHFVNSASHQVLAESDRRFHSSPTAPCNLGSIGSRSSSDDIVGLRSYLTRPSGSEARLNSSSSGASHSSYSYMDFQRDLKEITALIKALAKQLKRISIVCFEDMQPLLDYILLHCDQLEALRILDSSGRCFGRRQLHMIRTNLKKIKSLDIALVHGNIFVADLVDFVHEKPPCLLQLKFHGDISSSVPALSRSATSLTPSRTSPRHAAAVSISPKMKLENYTSFFKSNLDCWYSTTAVDMWQISEHSAALRGWCRQFELFHFSSVKPFTL